MPEAWQSRTERPTPIVPLVHVRLEGNLEGLKQEPMWRSSDRNAITLTKEPHLRVVLIAMKKGARLHEHRASGPITIQAVSGSLRLSASDQILELKPGELAILESAIEHEVEALEESALLLTLVKPT